MKALIYSLAFAVLFIAACSGAGNNSRSAVTSDSSSTQAGISESLEKDASAEVLLSAYFELKNAFTVDDDQEAAAAGKKMVAAFASFDQKSLKGDQSKVYTDIQDDAKEHAEHIGANAGNIVHQREHFEMLSRDMYDLVKLLGTNRAVYTDHCPMYNHHKGAIWLSEIKKIKNPYMGKAMSGCGIVQEELK